MTIVLQSYKILQAACKRDGMLKNTRNFAKRSFPTRNCDSCNSLDIPSSNPLDGSRIVNFNQLQKFVTELSAHAAQCDSDDILNGE